MRQIFEDRDRLKEAASERVGGVDGVLRLAATFKVTRTSLAALSTRHGFSIVEDRGALKADEKPTQRPRRTSTATVGWMCARV